MAGGTYMTVPNPGEADLGADRPTSYMSEGSILHEPGFLGPRDGPGPAPSIMSRDSTFSSLTRPGSILGANDGPRSSWGSNMALGANEGPIAGAEYGARPRVTSNLAYSSPFPDDEEQGHIQPNAAVPASDEKVPAWAGGPVPKKRKSRALFWSIVLAAVLVCLGVGLGVGLGISKPWSKNGDANGKENSNGEQDKNSPDSNTDGNNEAPTAASSSAQPSATPSSKPTSGGKGSIITFEDGTTMTYENDIGGYWVFDPENPLNNSARCNDYTPSLDDPWDWQSNIIYGVNLGGWLNTEPFIVPGIYEDAPGDGTPVDEHDLSVAYGAGLEKAMRKHYDTFITERDFAEIATAGLNWIRLPIPHWAVKTFPGEPYLEGVAWEYVLKAFGWARKYGIRINLDLHTVPGSQNGWNHSGKIGLANWLSGPMGLANAQRSLDVIRTLTQFISQDQWAPVVQMFGFLNEPNNQVVSLTAIRSFYIEVYNMIRSITGKGKGPMISMHDAFSGGLDNWYNFARGADRMALDYHPYICFPNPGTPMPSTAGEVKLNGCNWAERTNQTSVQFGPNNAGEFSAAINDCGQWLNGVNLGQRYDGTYKDWSNSRTGSCDMWNDYRQWDQQTKDDLLTFVSGSMDALQNFFFWTWKIGNSTSDVPQPNPMWHYRLGWQQGWIPRNPRNVIGFCQREASVASNPFYIFANNGMTGGADGQVVLPTGSFPWPPASMNSVAAGDMSRIPQYTPTATQVTLAGPTYTAPGAQKAFDFGSGWANPSDKQLAFAPIEGCEYMNEYSALDEAIPATACGAGLAQPTRRSLVEERAPLPVITAPPL